MDFHYFFIPYVFEIKESISRGVTKLPCSGDLENLGQLPVSEELQGTDDWVLWISVISSFLTFSMSRNLFIVVSHGLFCSGDLENSSQLPVLQELKGTDDWVLWIFKISLFFTLSRSRNLLLAVSQSYHVWVNSKIQVNFRFRRYSRVLSIGSYGFEKFLSFLTFAVFHVDASDDRERL